MLTLVGYDLHEDSSKFFTALKTAAEHCGDALDLNNGPIFVDSKEIPREILATLENELGELGPVDIENDQLLVLQVARSTCCGWAVEEQGLEDVKALGGQDPVAWFAARCPPRHRRVLGITYRLHSRRHREVKAAIESQVADKTKDLSKFLNALWFIETKKSAAAVLHEVWMEAGLEAGDLLMVFEVGTCGAQVNIKNADVQWFESRGVQVAGG